MEIASAIDLRHWTNIQIQQRRVCASERDTEKETKTNWNIVFCSAILIYLKINEPIKIAVETKRTANQIKI